MRANEFIKEFGWDKTKECLENCASPNDKWFIYEGVLICDDEFDELKRLVESWELVESRGGLDGSWKYYDYLCDANEFFSSHETNIYASRLEQAIKDVDHVNRKPILNRHAITHCNLHGTYKQRFDKPCGDVFMNLKDCLFISCLLSVIIVGLSASFYYVMVALGVWG